LSAFPLIRIGMSHLHQRLVRIEAKLFELPVPFSVGIPQALDVDTAWQSSFDCCFDELRRKEG
jgi:hypothetical protein